MINKAVYVLREMSADERTREIARQRERILRLTKKLFWLKQTQNNTIWIQSLNSTQALFFVI